MIRLVLLNLWWRWQDWHRRARVQVGWPLKRLGEVLDLEERD